MSLGDSILQTASIARCVSEAVIATDQTTAGGPTQAAVRRDYNPAAFRCIAARSASSRAASSAGKMSAGKSDGSNT